MKTDADIAQELATAGADAIGLAANDAGFDWVIIVSPDGIDLAAVMASNLSQADRNLLLLRILKNTGHETFDPAEKNAPGGSA
jgi:hypothetical protein